MPIGKTAENSATDDAASKHKRQNAETGHDRAWKFTRPIQAATPMPMANPSTAPMAPRAAASAAKNPLTSALGCSQGFHDGEIAATVEDPGR